MAGDAAKFEWKKFCITLKDSETEISDLSLISEFRDTESWVEENRELFMAVSPKPFMKLLRRLNDELGECRIVWQHYYNQVTDKKKQNMVRFNPLSKKWWVVRTRRKSLAQIREEMLQEKDLIMERERERRLIAQIREEMLAAGKRAEGEGTEINGSDQRRNVAGKRAHHGEEEGTTAARKTAHLIHSNVIGFDEFADEIEDVLLGIRREDSEKKEDDGFIACGVTGMGGVGKTELARKVFNSPRIRQEFPTQIWVCLADYRPIDTGVQIEMLKYMVDELDQRGVVVRNGGVVELLDELRNGLSRRKYLIVLDGAWQDHPWFLNLQYHTGRHSDEDDKNYYRLSDGFPSGGGAVIVTSRREHLVKRMVGEHSFTTRLDHETSSLQEICCWIFQDRNSFEEILLRRETGEQRVRSIGKYSNSILIRQVFDSPRIVDEFPTRIWIHWLDLNISSVDDDDERKALTLQMLHKLKYDYDYDYETYNDGQLINMLRRELSIRKFFIVWDGVPYSKPYDKWYHDLFCKSSTGDVIDLDGAVIVATKGNKSTTNYYSSSNYKYNSQKLQASVVQMLLEKIKDDIKYKFQGLPLAAQSLARVIPRQLEYLVEEGTVKENSGGWSADLEFCVIYKNCC